MHFLEFILIEIAPYPNFIAKSLVNLPMKLVMACALIEEEGL